jgi:L-asparaginase II
VLGAVDDVRPFVRAGTHRDQTALLRYAPGTGSV